MPPKEGGATLGLYPGIKTLQLFHLGPRWDPKILWPCLPNGISVLVLLVLELHPDGVH